MHLHGNSVSQTPFFCPQRQLTTGQFEHGSFSGCGGKTLRGELPDLFHLSLLDDLEVCAKPKWDDCVSSVSLEHQGVSNLYGTNWDLIKLSNNSQFSQCLCLFRISGRSTWEVCAWPSSVLTEDSMYGSQVEQFKHSFHSQSVKPCATKYKSISKKNCFSLLFLPWARV